MTVTYNYIPNDASLSGSVYLDANDNGSFDSGETGISGVTLTLAGNTAQGTAVNQTTITGNGGAYSFTNLAAGTYSITETPPANYLNGQDNLVSLGATNGTVGTNNLSGISVAQGDAGTNYNFGELLPSGLAGFVYSDSNNDGVFESNESGIAGVTLTLTGTNDLGASVNQTTTTGSGGGYSFQNLRPAPTRSPRRRPPITSMARTLSVR